MSERHFSPAFLERSIVWNRAGYMQPRLEISFRIQETGSGKCTFFKMRVGGGEGIGEKGGEGESSLDILRENTGTD